LLTQRGIPYRQSDRKADLIRRLKTGI